MFVMDRYLSFTRGIPTLVFGCLLSVALVAGAAEAQDVDRHLTLLGIPSATVAPGGTGFATLGITNDRSGTATGSDASLAVGLGFGDANTGIGGHVFAEITSLTDDPADSGYFGGKLVTRIEAASVPLYLGVLADRVGAWGDAAGLDPSASVLLTAFPRLSTASGSEVPLMLTFGAGTDARRDPATRDTSAGIYAGAGIGLSETLAASAAWSGNQVVLGLGYRPSQYPNMSLNAGIVDAFDQVNDRRFVIGATIVFDSLFGGR